MKPIRTGYPYYTSIRLEEVQHAFKASMGPVEVAQLRGWALSHGTPTPEAPRNGCLWNESEDGDLATGHGLMGASVSDMARRHGRTYIAIEMRLAALGLTTPADDFRDEPLPEAPSKENAMLKMTANRLMTLLALHRGTYHNELKVATAAADLTFLRAEGLVSRAAGMDDLTTAGRELIGQLLNQTSTNGTGASTAWDSDRNTSTLDNQRFFLVVSGDCQKRGGGPGATLPTLKNPPRVVQSSIAMADSEAVRLAQANPGAKFFVMQAVSVHQVTTPVASHRL